MNFFSLNWSENTLNKLLFDSSLTSLISFSDLSIFEILLIFDILLILSLSLSLSLISSLFSLFSCFISFLYNFNTISFFVFLLLSKLEKES